MFRQFLKAKFSVGGKCPQWCYSLMHLVDTGKNVKGQYEYYICSQKEMSTITYCPAIPSRKVSSAASWTLVRCPPDRP